MTTGSPPTIDWAAVEVETIGLLQALIRIDTSNPPGDVRNAAEHVARLLSADGIATTRLDMDSRRANLVARISGSGSQGPLLFMTHLDVVPAGAGWRHPPFGGVIADGHVWGRGAVDMKHIVAAVVAAVRLAVRCSMPLQRDIILIATADEETAGETGAGWLFREHPELVQAEIAVNEGGDSMSYGNEQFLLIETAEKGWGTIHIRRTSPAAHSSLPTHDNSLIEIAEIAARLGHARFPHHVRPVVRELVEGLARTQNEQEAVRLLALLQPATCDKALRTLTCDEGTRKRLDAMLFSHASPTQISGGNSAFTIPEETVLTISGRLLPGEPIDGWLATLETMIGALGDHELTEFQPGAEFATGPFYDVLANIAARHSPGVHVLPTLLPGGGDLRHAAANGAQAYGFFPLPLAPHGESLLALAHARDERIRLEHVALCVRYAWDVLCHANHIPHWQSAPLGRAA